MLPDNFDPLWAALGIKRNDWLKSLVKPTPVPIPISSTQKARGEA